MASLKFICPNTQHLIDSEVETDARTFHLIESERLQLKCPRCGATHSFQIKEGRPADAA
jgi:hypothetical protein